MASSRMTVLSTSSSDAPAFFRLSHETDQQVSYAGVRLVGCANELACETGVSGPVGNVATGCRGKVCAHRSVGSHIELKPAGAARLIPERLALHRVAARYSLEALESAMTKPKKTNRSAIAKFGGPIVRPSRFIAAMVASRYGDDPAAQRAIYDAEAIWVRGEQTEKIEAYALVIGADLTTPSGVMAACLGLVEQFPDSLKVVEPGARPRPGGAPFKAPPRAAVLGGIRDGGGC